MKWDKKDGVSSVTIKGCGRYFIRQEPDKRTFQLEVIPEGAPNTWNILMSGFADAKAAKDWFVLSWMKDRPEFKAFLRTQKKG